MGSSTMWEIRLQKIPQIKTSNHLFQSIAGDITFGEMGRVGGCLILDVVYALKTPINTKGSQ
ncbi:hypothetical protein OUZ56_024214 [Daphnia magna]|uniref:Uncharacterized protein n=1 Tax=Daphnia magna TaxID=35525 RepID=A0ABR0B0B8_9CRUS|nr:hypothetical protein OUZ56_024214 [Daphnia magna]